MTKNVGNTDKIIRVVIAVIALYLGYAVSGWFYLITAIGLITAAIGFCPLYVLLKVNTAKKAAKSEKPAEKPSEKIMEVKK